MNDHITLTLFVLTVACCMGFKPTPFFREYRTIDRIYNTSKASSERELGLNYLERIADGQTVIVDPAAASRFGVAPADLESPALHVAEVRAHAIIAIGNLGGPEAVSFLEAKTRSNIDADVAAQVWPVVQAAIQAARLSLIIDPPAIRDFLKDSIARSGAVADWGVNQICNRGIIELFPSVRESIMRRDHSSSAYTEISFCEERIRILARDENRALALASVLEGEDSEVDSKLIRWAIEQLGDDGSAQADEAIERFRKMASALPANSEKWQKLGGFVQEIDEIRLRRRQ